uniref:ATP-dependent DNA helicase PIF1-like n=1 Tax=Erigeron canadensis TaxID=72917 RepID=UPI001CB8FD4A|nr:ATP-dependent DNA helicase PIF1-like [Erigeron canadensis]
MELQHGCPSNEIAETKAFAEWILKIGEGKIGDSNDGEDIVEFPDDVIIRSAGDHIQSITSVVYPAFEDHLNDPTYFQDKAILVPTNVEVDAINEYMLGLMKEEGKTYLSSASLCETESPDDFKESFYAPDVLNGFKASGIPNHKLTLKVGVPVMLLRNIDQRKGLCNGTRLQIVRMAQHVIEARIISGKHFNEITYIPRMKLVPSDKRIPFRFQRRQFPLSVCFAMTINKSQGQSLSNVGLYLRRPVFTHGQLYVAVSRVTSKRGLKVLICDEGGHSTNKTKNVVYKEVLQNL